MNLDRALLIADDTMAPLAAALQRLDASLAEAQELVPLLLSTSLAASALALCADMRSSAASAMAGLEHSGEVLSCDDVVGADRSRMTLSQRGLLSHLAGMADCAANLVLELRKRIRLVASA